ncbi:hypothetical protein PROVALCAL_01406, partial [Providencia alcalifaciens DSM 30120]
KEFHWQKQSPGLNPTEQKKKTINNVPAEEYWLRSVYFSSKSMTFTLVLE